jgi:nucleoid-associated protein EbfC
MFGDMMGKLHEMKQKMEESKKKLDALIVEGEAGNGSIKIRANGNRIIKSIVIKEELLKGEKEELEELLVVAMNRTLENADKVNEAEMSGTAKGMLPNFPGLF